MWAWVSQVPAGARDTGGPGGKGPGQGLVIGGLSHRRAAPRNRPRGGLTESGNLPY